MLSTPIQFMSLTENRTRQMKGMGFDEKDITDVTTTSSKRSGKSDQAPFASNISTNGKSAPSSGTQSTNRTSCGLQLQGATAVDKKDKKGVVA